MALVVKKKERKLGARSGIYTEASYLKPRYTPKTPPCTFTCPIGTDIRGYLTTISQSEYFDRPYEESYKKAWYIITDKNPFPAVCGRVCPHQCESDCNRKEKDEALGINNVERFIGDFGIKNKLRHKKINEESYPEKIAVVGSGPAGLSCAYQLARRGYCVTVFESSSKPGGMLRWAIPSYRLPKDVLDAEIRAILELGIETKYNIRIGKDIPLEDLHKEYQAIYLAIGAYKGLQLGVPGEDAPNVFACIEYLKRINSGERVNIGGKVIVIGGGSSAIDAARVCIRLGANVTVMCIESRDEMPAVRDEIEEAEREGVHIECSVAPLEILKDGNIATAVKTIRLESGKLDESGQPRLVLIEGSGFIVEADTIIAAISQKPDFTGLEQFKNEKGWISTNGRADTNVKGVFAGGDATGQAGVVIQAIDMGREAAETIADYLRGRLPAEVASPLVVRHTQMNLKYYEKLPRMEAKILSLSEPQNNFSEIAFTFEESQVVAEAKRCMSCGQCFFCDNCYIYCSDKAVLRSLERAQPYQFKLEFCKGQGCKKCAEECPCGCIDMV